jgi:hypothetical protein
MSPDRFIKISVSAGAIGALLSLLIYFSPNHVKQREEIEAFLKEDPEIEQRIGGFRSFQVRRITDYVGSPSDRPYTEYHLSVEGGKKSAWVRIRLYESNTALNDASKLEVVSID